MNIDMPDRQTSFDSLRCV